MNGQIPHEYEISRRMALRAGLGAVLGGVALSGLPRLARASLRAGRSSGIAELAGTQSADLLFSELDAMIEAGMARHHIPGVAPTAGGIHERGLLLADSPDVARDNWPRLQQRRAPVPS